MKKFNVNHEVPVFRPTWEEFKDFNKYVRHLEEEGAHHAGICKIIPPKEWKPRKSNSYDNVDSLVIEAPIKQKAHGSQGIFLQTLHVKSKMTVGELRQLANSPLYRTPDHNDWAHLEKKYWANIGLSTALYGADVCGSITDPDQDVWNIAHLGSILDEVFQSSGVEIKGVNTPYLYFGTWRATFAWHTEDVDLYSINYIHYGMPKQWYVIPPMYARRFEALAKEYYKSDYLRCKAFLRHKVCLISPSVLQVAGIPVNKITHEQGEIMITFPYGYHCGYNLGFNMAESTNFASERWIEFGKKAIPCHCRPDSVKIQMDHFVKRYQPELYADWLEGRDTTPHPLEIMYDKGSCVITGQKRRNSSGSTHSHPPKMTKEEDDESLMEAFFDSHQKLLSSIKRRSLKSSENQLEDAPLKKICANGSMKQQTQSDEENNPNCPEFLERLQPLWSNELVNFDFEKEFNKKIGEFEPFCSICSVLWSPPRVSDILHNRLKPSLNSDTVSELLIPEEAYIKDVKSRSSAPNTNSSRILRCSVCNVTVHARCYGLPHLDKASKLGKWLCDRCSEQALDAQCCLCPLRGGALKRLDCGDMPSLSPHRYENHTVCSETSKCSINKRQTKSIADGVQRGLADWAHVICTLGTWDMRFIDVALRRAVLPSYQDNWSSLRCSLCGMGNKAAPLAKCVYAVCSTHLHVTCAHLGGVLIESMSHPWSFYITCPKHRKFYAKFSPRTFSPLQPGEQVYAKHPYNHRYYKSLLKRKDSPMLYCIDFMDGTFSNDVPLNYIMERDCKKDGPPIEGSYVKVLWHDNKSYKGLFRGITPEKWEVEFETNEVVTLSREVIFKLDEDIPQRVLKRISHYYEKEIAP